MQTRMLFMDKKNRDALYRKLKREGREVRRTSTRNQLIHAQYISDYEKVTGVVLTEADKGFGNTIYKTHFKTLYKVIEEI